jgi:RNA polymerase sigma-70 factor (ECF subfamily)
LADHLAGKQGAFDALVRRHADELFAFLQRFVGNSAAADDLVQEAFLQVHLSADAFDPQRAFRPWLYTIAANKARDYLRGRGRRMEQSLDSRGPDDEGRGPDELVQAAGESSFELSSTEEVRTAVRSVIARMPEHLQLILMLGYFQRMPYSDIAEILGIPVGTVKSRLHAAVARFASMWQKQMRPERYT